MIPAFPLLNNKIGVSGKSRGGTSATGQHETVVQVVSVGYCTWTRSGSSNTRFEGFQIPQVPPDGLQAGAAEEMLDWPPPLTAKEERSLSVLRLPHFGQSISTWRDRTIRSNFSLHLAHLYS